VVESPHEAASQDARSTWKQQVSSNSSTERALLPGSVAAKLSHAFVILAHQCRPAHDEIARRIDGPRVRIKVDDEVFDVASMQGVPRVSNPEGHPSVTIETSRSLVDDVLAGRCTLAEGLRDDALRARGTLRDLVAVLAALEAFVHGAVRCEAMPELLDDFQTERIA
jgi:hypothetical protein